MTYESRPGIELFTLGDDEERLCISNGLSNGLRLEIVNDDLEGVACFHITSKELALEIAAMLVEFAERKGNPR